MKRSSIKKILGGPMKRLGFINQIIDIKLLKIYADCDHEHKVEDTIFSDIKKKTCEICGFYYFQEEESDTPKITEKFVLSCKKCGSRRIDLIDGRGYSPQSGNWGELKLHCINCDTEEEILENE